MEAKRFPFIFKFLGKDYEAEYTIKLDKEGLQRVYVDFEDDDSYFFWEDKYLFSYDATRVVVIFPPMSPSDFELISSVSEAIMTLEYFNPD